MSDYPTTPEVGDARVDIELFLVAARTVTSAETHEDVEKAAYALRGLVERAIAARHRLVEHERNALYQAPPVMGRPSWARLYTNRRP